MKFSKELSARADLRFLKEYISYKELKKAIKVITGSDVHVCTVRDVVSNFNQTDALTGSIFRPPESRFQDLLNHELEKVNSFSRGKIFELFDDLDDIQDGLSYLQKALLLLQEWLDKKNAARGGSSPFLSAENREVRTTTLSVEEDRKRYEQIQEYLSLASRVLGEGAADSSYYKQGENKKKEGVEKSGFADHESSRQDAEEGKDQRAEGVRRRVEKESGGEGGKQEDAGPVERGKEERDEGDWLMEKKDNEKNMALRNAKERGGGGGEEEEESRLRGYDADDEERRQDLLLKTGSRLLELENFLDFQGREVIFLDSFVRLNFTGFRKITKKYDKHHKSSAAGWYMSRVVRQDFMNLNFSLLLSHLAAEFAFLFSLKSLFSRLQQHSFFPLSSDLELGTAEAQAKGGGEQGEEGMKKKMENKNDGKESADEDGHGRREGRERGGLGMGGAEQPSSPQEQKDEGRKPVDGGGGGASLFYSPLGGGSEWGGGGGEEEEEQGRSSDGSQFTCRKFLVPPDELMKIKVFIAKHLPLTVAGGVHVASPFLGQENRRSFLIPFSTSASSSLPEEKEKDREMLKKQRKKKTAVVLGGGKIPTWEVYLENDDFFYYTSTRPWIVPPSLSDEGEENGKRESVSRTRLPRVRWQGQAALASTSRLVVLELSHPSEASWDPQEDVIAQPSLLAAGGVASSTSPPSPLLSSFSTLMSQRHLQSLLQGRFSTLEAFLAEVLDAEYAAASLTSQEVRQSRTSAALTSGGYRATEDGGAVAKEKKDEEGRPPEEEMKSKRREDVLGVLTAVWEAVQQRRVKPCLRTWFYRTQYRTDEATVYINVDEDVRFSRELNRSAPATQWLRSETEALTADDVQAFPWGILNISYPSSSSSASVVQDVTRCPYPGISQEDLDGFPPSSSSGSFSFPSSKTFDDFVAELTGLSTVTEVQGFSLFAHGIGCMYTGKLRKLGQRSFEQPSLQASASRSVHEARRAEEGDDEENVSEKSQGKRSPVSSSQYGLLPPWLAYTSSGALYDEDSEEEGGREEGNEREERRKREEEKNREDPYDDSRGMLEKGGGGGGRKQESRGRGGESGDGGMVMRGCRGSAIDVVHKGTSASLVHELQSRAHECPPSGTTSEFDHHHHHAGGGGSSSAGPCCQSRRSSGLYTSTPLLLSTSPPPPPILEGSALYRPANAARTLLRQPLLGGGVAGEEDEGVADGSRSERPSRSRSQRSDPWYTVCFRPYWCRLLCAAGFFSSSSSAGGDRLSPSSRGEGAEGTSPSRRRGAAAGGGGGRCRRLATCLFPWRKRRSARRLIHPSYPATPHGGEGGGGGGATVRVEPKTFFANERTLLQWMNTAVLIATLSITLMNFGDPMGRLAGLVMAPVAVFFIGYSFWVYLRRARALERKEPINYNDKLGPSILVLTLICSLSAVILLNILYPDEKHPGHTAPPSNIDQDTKTSISPSSVLSQTVVGPSSSFPSSSLSSSTSAEVFSLSSPSSVVSPVPESVTSAAVASIAALRAASEAVASFTENQDKSPELSKFVSFSSSANLHAKAAYAYAEAARAAALAAKQIAGEGGEKEKKKKSTRWQQKAEGLSVHSHKSSGGRGGRRGERDEEQQKDTKTKVGEVRKARKRGDVEDEEDREDDRAKKRNEEGKESYNHRTGESQEPGGKQRNVRTDAEVRDSSSPTKEESEHHGDSASHESPVLHGEDNTRAPHSGPRSGSKRTAAVRRGEGHAAPDRIGATKHGEHEERHEVDKRRQSPRHHSRDEGDRSSMWSGVVNSGGHREARHVDRET